jgi:hypothetical protein
MSGKNDIRAQRNSLLCLAAVVALILTVIDTGFAQNPWARQNPSARQNPWAQKNPWANAPSPKKGADKASSYSSGSVATSPDVIVPIPSMVLRGGQYIDNGAIPDGLQAPRRPPKRLARRKSERGAARY